MKSNDYHVWEVDNEYLQKHFILKEKMIPWEGEIARLTVAIDVTEKEIMSQKMQAKIALQERLIKEQAEGLHVHSEDILKVTKLGLWVIRQSKDGRINQMFADDTLKEIMGIQGDITPEECYYHWYNRINNGYFRYVNYSVKNMIDTGNIVELEYTWNHPEKGEVTVRCLGVRVADSDGMICLHGYHREINEVDRPNFLPDATSTIFEYNEKKKAVYFHTDRGALAGSEEKEEDFPACWIASGMVHPHFVKQFEAVFTNIQEQPELEGQEFLLKAKDGSFDWFKMKTRHLGDGDQDANIMVVLLDPAKQERIMELEYMRQKDFYKAVLSDAIAYAEIDMESHRILTVGGLWSAYADEKTRNEKTYEEVLTQYKHLVVHPEDVEAYEKFLNVSTLRELMGQGKDTGKLQLRRIVDGKMHWVELTGHIFQEQFSENIYALIYMKDIDAEKRREMAQELAATRDPLTKVYNRSAFEEEVVRHMLGTEEGACGTLVMLDMDNFKYINDNYGHAVGDQVLKRLADVLLTTFRRKDIIGRLGGDEFVVFLKNVTNKETIDHRMEELGAALTKGNEYRTTCSVGITFVYQENFSYGECLNRADIALYKSKEMGKNRYCYYEEKKS